jgi:hypothetical protein
VYFTRHAKNKLREGKLTQADAEFVVRSPSRKERDTRGNWRYLGQVEGKWIRVVVADDDPDVVITVHPRRQP